MLPNNIYKQLTCRLRLPNLENIYIRRKGLSPFGNSALEFTVNNYTCNCNEPCLYNLSWLYQVYLFSPEHVTSCMLTCLGVKKEHHNDIINNMRAAGHYCCIIKGEFGMIRELRVNIRLFRSLLPYLSTNHVEQVELVGNITDDVVTDVSGLLSDVVCEELVISGGWYITTTQLADILVNA